MNQLDVFFTNRKFSLQTNRHKDNSTSHLSNLPKFNIDLGRFQNNPNYPKKSAIKINKGKLPLDFFKNQCLDEKNIMKGRQFNIQISPLIHKKINSQSEIDQPEIMSSRDYKDYKPNQSDQLFDKTSYFGFSEKPATQNTSNANRIKRNYYTRNQQREKNDRNIQQKNEIKEFQTQGDKKSRINKIKEDDSQKTMPLANSLFKNKGLNKLFYGDNDVNKQGEKIFKKKTGEQFVEIWKKLQGNQNRIENITFFNGGLLPPINKQFQ